MLIYQELSSRVSSAARQVLPEASLEALAVKPCPDPRHGDYQVSGVIGLAKAMRLNPRQVASDLLARLDASDLCGRIEVAGPGFINFQVKVEALARAMASARTGSRLFVEPREEARTVVIDFSSPNVAKPMHIGHIRSTILGDSLARVMRLLGHRVITDNHIGDWGTQFGKLILGWKTELDRDALSRDPIGELERIYRLINGRCEDQADLLEAARKELVQLQAGDSANRAVWEEMIRLSQKEFEAVYGRLGVRFDHTLGESFYNPFLKTTVEELVRLGVARESEGAQVVFFDDLPELKGNPAIIQKRDGAANYATTDLATIHYRCETWRPDEIVYVTDGRQQLHFKQIFAAFRRWQPEQRVKLAHVWFGSILGEDGKPFRTRSGDTIRLTDLLDEAEERAYAIVAKKNPDLSQAEQRTIARIVGIGAVKYADLLPNRQSDYVFSWDKMLALSGNTAPYLQYAYTRIRSIFRKAESESVTAEAYAAAPIVLQDAAEVDLAKHLHNFGLVLGAVAEDHRPNYLCNYLYELAGRFTAFYERCPVLKADVPIRLSRLALCDLTAKILRQGLDVLGIETTDQM